VRIFCILTILSDNLFSVISDDSWHVFITRFAASVQHITGQELEVKAASDSDSIIEQELEALRTKVEELSDEVRVSRWFFVLPTLTWQSSVPNCVTSLTSKSPR